MVRLRVTERTLQMQYRSLLNSTVAFDVTVTALHDASQRHVRACKCVLSSWSPVFESMFFGSQDSRVKSIALPTDFETIEIVMKYIHGIEVDIPFHSLWRLYLLVSAYQIVDLVSKVEDILDNTVNADTCCELLMEGLMSGNRDHPAIVKSRNCALVDFATVWKTPGFMSLDFSLLESLLSSDELNAPEEDIFTAALAWLEHDKSRIDKLDSILLLIRFPLLPATFVLSLETHPVVSTSGLLNGLIMQSLKYHMGTYDRQKEHQVSFRQRKGGLFWSHSLNDTCMNVVGDRFTTFTLSSSSELLNDSWKIEYELFPVDTQIADVVFGLTTSTKHSDKYYVGRNSNGFGVSLSNGNFYNGKCKCDEDFNDLCTPVCPTFLSMAQTKGWVGFRLNPKTSDMTITSDQGSVFTRRILADAQSRMKFYPCVSLVNAKAKIVTDKSP